MTKQKRGRPIIEAPTQGVYKFRTTYEDRALMNFLEQNTGMSKSDILRKGMRMLYNNVKYKGGADMRHM